MHLVIGFFHAAGQDFSGVPVNLTFFDGVTVQLVNITIIDDNIVEPFEVIRLILTTENPNVIVLTDQFNPGATISIAGEWSIDYACLFIKY